jgi:predicted nucleic acid-binding Zn ribbon protein
VSDEPTADGPDGPPIEAVPAALARARKAARRRGTAPSSRAGQSGTRRAAAPRDRSATRRPGELPELTAAGPDPRDPQPISDLVEAVVSEREWATDVRVGSIVGRWAEIVGADVAAHARPERFEDGHLFVAAESTAWAAQLRLLSGVLTEQFAAELGPGVVRTITVRGPTGPSWRSGPWRVAGRGPRDTYG